MALPAVRNLKALLGDRPLTVTAPEKLAALWEACPFVDQVLALPHPGTSARLPPRCAKSNSRRRCCCPTRCARRWRSGRHAFRSASATQGWARPAAHPHRAHSPARSGAASPEVVYVHLAAAVGAPMDVPPAGVAPAHSGFRFARCDALRRVVSGRGIRPRQTWPVENFAAVGQALAAQGYRLVILGAAGDAPLAANWPSEFPAPGTSRARRHWPSS